MLAHRVLLGLWADMLTGDGLARPSSLAALCSVLVLVNERARQHSANRHARIQYISVPHNAATPVFSLVENEASAEIISRHVFLTIISSRQRGIGVGSEPALSPYHRGAQQYATSGELASGGVRRRCASGGVVAHRYVAVWLTPARRTIRKESSFKIDDTSWNRHYGVMRRGFRAGVVLAIGVAGAIGCGSVRDVTLRDAPLADGSSDPIDAPIDAARPLIAYDVGYINDITVNPTNTGTFGFLAIVNTGTAPLDLLTATVVLFGDDSTLVDWSFAKRTDSSTKLLSGRAGGFLTVLAIPKVLAPGVVTEPVDDANLNFSMSFGGARTSGTTIQAQAVISIADLQATLPFKIIFDDTADTRPNTARRISAGP